MYLLDGGSSMIDSKEKGKITNQRAGSWKEREKQRNLEGGEGEAGIGKREEFELMGLV